MLHATCTSIAARLLKWLDRFEFRLLSLGANRCTAETTLSRNSPVRASRSHSLMARRTLTTAAVVMAVMLDGRVETADDVCNPQLKPVAGHVGYAKRGDGRCEGSYQQNVEHPSQLFLAALWEASIGETWSDHVRFAWTPDVLGTLRIVAMALGPRDYYQMDALVDGARGSSIWSTDVVQGSGIRPRSFGAIAFHESPRRVYVPLSTGERRSGSRTYRTLLLSGADIATLSGEMRDDKTSSLVVTHTGRSQTFASQGIARN